MSDRHDHEQPSQPDPGALESGAADAKLQALQRRRRFIKLGAGAVPVSLTLASRPVMAWHCNTTSAWGSAILRNGAASVQARAEDAIIYGTECWTIANWVNNTVRSAVGSGTPWSYAKTKYMSSKTETYCRNNLTIGTLFPGGLKNASATDKVKDKLAANQSNFIGYMIVARLNTHLAGHRVNECLISNGADTLVTMAKDGPGVFKPNGDTGLTWSEAEIIRYLRENYVVIAS